MRRSALLLLAVAASAGCGSGSKVRTVTVTTTAGTPPVTQPATTTTQGSVASTVVPYFIEGDQVAAGEPVATPERGVAAVALRAVLDGPNGRELAAGLTTAVPPDTRLLDLAIADGLARVDLSGRFREGEGAPATRERLAQVVYTLTQFPTVKTVRLRIDGHTVSSLGGVKLDRGLTRGDFENETPAILVELPGFGTAVSSPFTARGTANTFEATFEWELRGASGDVLAKHFETATSGTGTRGTFYFPVAFRVGRTTQGSLVVFERSAADGSRIHVRSIPLTLQP
jgi:germination protein M